MTGDRKPSAEDMDAAIAALSQHGDPLRPYQVEAVAKAIAERVNREVERRREAEADTARLDWLDKVNRNMNERNGSHYGWRYEINHLRAALTDHNYPPLTIREAIDAAR